MNKKSVSIGIIIVIIASLSWIGRTMYRTKHNLVSLDVYGTPLAEVIKRLQRQTRETILVGKDLDARITLKLSSVPLDEALDRVGQQAGANWSKWHAVHNSKHALDQLETALRNHTKLAEVGWTNVAPQDFAGGPGGLTSAGGPDGLPPMAMAAGATGEGTVTVRKPVVIKLDSKDIKNGDVEAAVREQLKAAGVSASVMAQAGAAVRQTVDLDVQAKDGGSNVVVKASVPHHQVRVVTRSRDGNGQVTTEFWSPEHVVLEQRLQSRLGDETFTDASETIARDVAKKAKASLTTLYVLSKSPGGFPLAGKMIRRIETHAGDGTNQPHGELHALPDIESVVKRAEAENYLRLTPEQRVQRAREKQAAKSKQ